MKFSLQYLIILHVTKGKTKVPYFLRPILHVHALGITTLYMYLGPRRYLDDDDVYRGVIEFFEISCFV